MLAKICKEGTSNDLHIAVQSAKYAINSVTYEAAAKVGNVDMLHILYNKNPNAFHPFKALEALACKNKGPKDSDCVVWICSKINMEEYKYEDVIYPHVVEQLKNIVTDLFEEGETGCIEILVKTMNFILQYSWFYKMVAKKGSVKWAEQNYEIFLKNSTRKAAIHSTFEVGNMYSIQIMLQTLIDYGVADFINLLRTCCNAGVGVKVVRKLYGIVPIRNWYALEEWILRHPEIRMDVARFFVINIANNHTGERKTLFVQKVYRQAILNDKLLWVNELAKLFALPSFENIQLLRERAEQIREEQYKVVVSGPQKEVLEIDTCAVCLDTSSTLMTTCGHTFCQPCLEQCNRANFQKCPICRQKYDAHECRGLVLTTGDLMSHVTQSATSAGFAEQTLAQKESGKIPHDDVAPEHESTPYFAAVTSLL